MGLNRRTFLQKAGLGLLALGASHSRLPLGINRYYQTLAAPTPRKLALLVGINEYPDSTSLKGCLTDVELQQELLVHRFGFKSQDILTLTGQQAGREAIESAFLEHLIEQATPGDVVVFHFSGYGRQVKVPETVDKSYRLVNSLMPSDSILTTKGTPATNDLLEETLLLLGRSLATNKVTFVLDTSYCSTGRLLQGNLRVRSFPTLAENPNPEELATQEQLQRRLNAALPTWKSTGTSSSGTILSAAGRERVATEIAIDGLNAGLFTHTLTQYLWQVAPASRILVAMTRTAEQMAVAIGMCQEPQQISGDKQPLLTYYLMPENPIGAEGVITRLEDDRAVEILLAGLPAYVLAHYGLNSCLMVVPSPDSKEVVVQIRSREGLKAKARLLEAPDERPMPLKVGQLLQESIRILPRHLSLTVALDPSLERIERVDATSALASVAAVAGAIAAGEQAADCVLSKVRAADSSGTTLASTQDNLGVALGWEGYGLLSAGGVALANAKGSGSEAVKSAIARLEPQFKQLLAAKWWRLTANEGSSNLAVSATLEIAGKPPQSLIRRDTRRQAFGADNSSLPANTTATGETAVLPRLPIGTQIQYRLENLSDRPIYFLLLGIDSGGRAIALHAPRLARESAPAEASSQLKERCLLPGEQLVVPNPTASVNWLASAPAGLAEMHVVCAHAPFAKTVEALSSKEYLKGDREQIFKVPNPLEVALALLQDLHDASAVKSEIIGSLTDVYALDTKAWATLSFVYQVVSSSQ
ncbi:Caspase domain-containing protein [Pleurocapsa sp. PCC 7327]|uniref:caspase family protein n=1 Tax=Pleurocapsa sp. PCC 7327 TaxID=118163 RepID=UPI00029F9B25|nr:caspase family protein [Pleurocapsa sp. PCC 7327]AFY77324.1 Caspase domain-containing protein [Pleurocapsa sp. PCC 7327]